MIPYSASKRTITGFLGQNGRDLGQIDGELARLRTRLATEADGWSKDELKRNIACLEQFKKVFIARRMKRFQFGPPADLVLKVEEVRINARMDLSLVEQGKDGITRSGGCTLLIASTDAARRNVEERRKIVAGLVFWALQDNATNIQPLERLCLSFDVFGAELVPASSAIDRFRANVRTSCREAANSWDGVEPPSGYDGPDWR